MRPTASPMGGPRKPAEPGARGQGFLMVVLVAAVIGVFFLDALPRKDWEILATKHYWSARGWYYGGYASQLAKTADGYRTVQKEALSNYFNLFPLQEISTAGDASHGVTGYPGTERLAAPWLLYVLLHFTGGGIDVWFLCWLANLLLWLLAIFLAYRTTELFFADRCAPWFSAILVALYPVLTLTFGAIKQQPMGTIYLLVGIYLFERHLKSAGMPLQIAGLTGLEFFGQFDNGAWLYIAAFLLLRACWLPRGQRWVTVSAVIIAAAASMLGLKWLAGGYHLPSLQRDLAFSTGRMFAESSAWLRAWTTGKDVGELRFANYPGTAFFTAFLPLIIRAFVAVHAPLLLVALMGAVIEPRTRMFLAMAAPMLLVGHSGHIMARWVYHYGYMSFPAGLMIIFAAAGTLGRLWAEGRRGLRVLLGAALLCTGFWFSDLKRQAGLYYGGNPDSYRQNLLIYDGDESAPLRY